MDEFVLSTKRNDIEFSDNSTKQGDEFENLEIVTDNESKINGDHSIENSVQINTNKVGRVFKAFYHNGEPLIVIGPHCIMIS